MKLIFLLCLTFAVALAHPHQTYYEWLEERYTGLLKEYKDMGCPYYNLWEKELEGCRAQKDSCPKARYCFKQYIWGIQENMKQCIKQRTARKFVK